jgi:hypothetical protein
VCVAAASLTVDSVFDATSIRKQFVAVAILLVE